MSLFNAHEWANFRRVVLRRPWHWPGYAFSLAQLVARRLTNSIRLRHRKAPHLGLKKRPDWLPEASLVRDGSSGRTLVWPDYASVVTPPVPLPPSAFADNGTDPEAVLARHRWGDCLFATVAGGDSAGLALEQVSAWLVAPPERSDAAWETYSCCERVVNLAVLLASRPDCRQRIDEAVLRQFFEESLEWIDRRLEYYGLDRTNNHLLNNARALVVAGSVVQHPAAVASGLLTFARMSRELFGSSGFLRERSSHYQLVVANWLFDVLHFARAAPPLEPPALAALQELAALAGRVAGDTGWLIRGMGETGTHIGDISPDAHPQWTLQRLYRLYPEYFEDADRGTEHGSEWLLAGRERGRLLACSLPASYPAGYADHGHRDLGSFLWIHDGCLILADAGRSTYANGETARFQCSTAAHNSLCINGLEPLAESLLNAGLWLPGPYAAARVDLRLEGEALLLEHDGFGRIPGVGNHRRSACCEANGLRVEDRLEGDAAVRLDIYWHFPSGFARTDAAGITGHGMRIDVVPMIGSASPELVWDEYPYAAAYGEQQTATMLTVRTHVQLPCSISTFFRVTPCAA